MVGKIQNVLYFPVKRVFLIVNILYLRHNFLFMRFVVVFCRFDFGWNF